MNLPLQKLGQMGFVHLQKLQEPLELRGKPRRDARGNLEPLPLQQTQKSRRRVRGVGQALQKGQKIGFIPHPVGDGGVAGLLLLSALVGTGDPVRVHHILNVGVGVLGVDRLVPGPGVVIPRDGVCGS